MNKLRLFIVFFVFLILCTSCIKSEKYEIKAEKTSISVLFGQSNSDPGVEEMFSEKINREFPNIRLHWESVNWEENFYSALKAKIALEDVPDIIIGKAQDTAAFQPSGYLAPIERDIYESIDEIALRSVSIYSIVYGVPLNMNYQGVIYNKEIFEKLNLKIPVTTDDLKSIVFILKTNGFIPFATHMRNEWYTANLLMQFVANEVFMTTPGWGDSFRTGNTSFTDSDAHRTSLETVKFIYDNTWADAFSVEQYESAKRFREGRAAMCVTDTHMLQSIGEVSQEMQLGIFPFPNTNSNAKLLYEPNMTIMINSKSDNKLLAMDIMSKIVKDDELIKQICEFTLSDPLIGKRKTMSLGQIREDVDSYLHNGMFADASVGNRQIQWSFQFALAKHINSWLAGQQTIESVILFADKNRGIS